MNKCKFVMKNNITCNNRCFGSLEHCHLRTHNNDKAMFDIEINRLKSEFNKSTLSKDTFTITTISRDGACMFKCLAKYLINNLESIKDSFPVHYLNIKEMDNDDSVSEYVQFLLKDWVIENSEKKISKFDMSLSELITIVHGDEGIMTVTDYDKYFGIYAGDYDFIIETESVNGKDVKRRVEIPERWGTILELYAFHTIFGININIFLLKKFDKKSGKIVVCTNRSKDYRFYLSETLSNDDDTNTKIMNLYFNTMYGSSHYQLLLDS